LLVAFREGKPVWSDWKELVTGFRYPVDLNQERGDSKACQSKQHEEVAAAVKTSYLGVFGRFTKKFGLFEEW